MTIAKAPISGREGHAAVWTGTQLPAWGGEDCWDSSGPRTTAEGAALTVRVGS